jgi:hypothetical protein
MPILSRVSTMYISWPLVSMGSSRKEGDFVSPRKAVPGA